ncbi:DUF2272 domain-containing protein [Herbaspirillum sp. YR522]|uniref:DUF2272 domain-containing protein n=1 Tax=Herbaspirillum sp. YR522 TaxID=1144342 RepID=UPI00026FB39D|nr:DUF2272 domain-containing protein [Herbaspirillum sp. YR522]EJN02854.1 hypothetical protein PMI40_03006 [Herbaspirillum sp. YR522]
MHPHRYLPLLAAAMLLAGCASQPLPQWQPGDPGYVVPTPAAPPVTMTAVPPVAISTAAPTRAALVAAARAEWDFFGNQQIDMRHEPFSSPRLGLLEDEGEAVSRVGQYWHAVGRNLSGADCDQPWSAAFISWLMVSTNVAPQDFAPSETHFNYLSFLRARQARPAPQFVLRPAASEPLGEGDLVCAPRGDNAATTLEDIRPGLAGHCDLVVEVHADEGWAGVIGGNVFNSVSESLIAVDPQGRALPFAQRPWLVVVKNLLP